MSVLDEMRTIGRGKKGEQDTVYSVQVLLHDSCTSYEV